MLNTARIAELKSEVGEDDFAEVVEIFCEEVEEVLDALPGTALTLVPEKLHFLKGSAFNIGMDDVGRLCSAEESRIKSSHGATPDIVAIVAAYHASKAELFG